MAATVVSKMTTGHWSGPRQYFIKVLYKYAMLEHELLLKLDSVNIQLFNVNFQRGLSTVIQEILAT